jgi:hypothetical protein
MTPKRSIHRVAALTGAAAFLFSLAHVSPAAAQASTRYVTTCTAQAQSGDWGEDCTMTVPAGKVFIIESATVHGSISAAQRVMVTLVTRFMGENHIHAVVGGSPSTADTSTYWTGAIPGTIFSEGHVDATRIVFRFTRNGSTTGRPYFRITLSGRLEDL